MQLHDHDVPFFANPDATHCYQAALKMVLGRFRPTLDHSWAELDRITGKTEGFGTWPFAGLMWLARQGLDLVSIEIMDNRRFAAEGRAYIAELTNKEFAESIDEGLDLTQVQADAAAFVATGRCEVRVPTLEDVRRGVAAGALVVCNVNSRALNGRDGYMGHFVVAKGFDESALIVHDPGPPGQANRRVPFELFERAWADPSPTIKWLVTISDAAAGGER